MKENKLGRMFANTWSPPPRIRCKGNHKFFTRMANKGVRKYAKLMIKAGESEDGLSEDSLSKPSVSIISLSSGVVVD